MRVKTSHRFVGNRTYTPEVTATNFSKASIAVVQVVLRKGSAVYENRPRQDASFPVAIGAGATKRLDVWFDLNEDIDATFKTPVEIVVQYRADEKDGFASATLVGGGLSASDP